MSQVKIGTKIKTVGNGRRNTFSQDSHGKLKGLGVLNTLLREEFCKEI